MPISLSIGAKIKRISGLIDTKDLTEAENRFIKNMAERTKDGLVTTMLSEAQADWIEDIHTKHFA
jgi:hypothetical protein